MLREFVYLCTDVARTQDRRHYVRNHYSHDLMPLHGVISPNAPFSGNSQVSMLSPQPSRVEFCLRETTSGPPHTDIGPTQILQPGINDECRNIELVQEAARASDTQALNLKDAASTVLELIDVAKVRLYTQKSSICLQRSYLPEAICTAGRRQEP